MQFDLVVIGGGAAGFFGAINYAYQKKDAKILIVEKTTKLLAKVKVSGGGRCNVTHRYNNTLQFAENYPRGKKELIGPIESFGPLDLEEWFKKRNINLNTEIDGRRFPETNDSQTIVDCFINEAERLGIKITLSNEVLKINPKEQGFEINTSQGVLRCKSILCAAGGNANTKHYSFLEVLGHTIQKPIPSLFTFNLPNNPITKLMGVSLEHVIITIPTLKKSFEGPFLITHWGLSGPAVLKLSAFCAKELAELNYEFEILLNFSLSKNIEVLKKEIVLMKSEHSAKLIINKSLFKIPSRLWVYLLEHSGIKPETKFADLSNKNIASLTENLYALKLQAKGKTTFKEEFVTCGGVSLKEINFKTMESKIIPNLYFAGEVLNIDGITGGFNFQAAWTTSFVAANSIAKKNL